jgi:DNA-binding Lrp family transcriptional regulator
MAQINSVYMPLQLDKYDMLILKSLLKDGRKSFREISRETGITTPTVKARFSRLVNIGFIKSYLLFLILRL